MYSGVNLSRERSHPVVPATIPRRHPEHTFSPPPKPKKTYQFKALIYKAYWNQKRQIAVNVCCLGLCPFLIVFLSAAMGAFTSSVLKTSGPSDVLYCSQHPDLQSVDWLTTDKSLLPVTQDVPGAHKKNITHMNAFVYPQRDPYKSKLDPLELPCEHWFGQRVDKNRIENAPDAWNWDTTFQSTGNHSWLEIMQNRNTPARERLIKDYSKFQMRSWAVFGGSSEALQNIRQVPMSRQLNLTAGKAYIETHPIKHLSFSKNLSLFERVETRLWSNLTQSNVTAFQIVPYFYQLPKATFPQEMDDYLGHLISSTVHSLSIMNKTVLFNLFPTEPELAAFYEDVDDITEIMAYGGIWFEEVNHDKLQYRYTLQFGSDDRLKATASFPSKGERLFLQQAQLSNAFLRQGNPEEHGKTVITQGLRVFPQLSTVPEYPMATHIANILFPVGLSCLLPIFVVTMVKEKESRILIMMRMNGVKVSMYILTHYISFFILYAFSAFSFLLTGWLSGLAFFRKTSLSVLVTVLYNWCHLLICMALLLSVFFDRSRRALVVVFLLMIGTILIADGLHQSLAKPLPVWVFYTWPPLTFYRALFLINEAANSPELQPYVYSDMVAGNDLYNCLLVMYAQTTICFALAGYLTYVLPSEFGVRRSWYYALTRLWRQIMGYRRRKHVSRLFTVTDMEGYLIRNRDAEDDLVCKERNRIMDSDYTPDTPLVVKNIRKVYSNGKIPGKMAIKSVTFSVEKNTVFGILGSNGSGKSSLIGILTGLFEASSGCARLAGYDIKTETKFVYQNIGICPQFNILWEHLTVREHLLFYARVKGINSNLESTAIQDCLETVELDTMQSQLASDLSSGEKRRLAIAIALVGNPSVIFLDEPTTDLDPIMKRQIWNIIHEVKKGRSIIMTTHSMEEAEICCQKFGIMANGCLATIGSLFDLRERYGLGYKLFIEVEPDFSNFEAQRFVESLLPSPFTKSQSMINILKYEFVPGINDVPRIFQVLAMHGKDHGIVDWKLSQKSLEDIFLTLVKEEEEDLC